MDDSDEQPREQVDWDRLGEFARRHDELDPIFLRGLLANALRGRGFGRLAWAEEGPPDEEASGAAPTVATLIFLWSSTVSIVAALGVAWFLAPLVLLGVLFAVGGLVKVAPGIAVNRPGVLGDGFY